MNREIKNALQDPLILQGDTRIPLQGSITYFGTPPSAGAAVAAAFFSVFLCL
jgi:hypothetical protein